MHAVRNAAGDTAPDGESPFTIHSTVYAQLARGWPKYSGNRSAVFSPAANEGSSGTDRFVCSDAKQASEGSQSNVDAGEFRTAGYKSPAEVEAVMISPTPIKMYWMASHHTEIACISCIWPTGAQPLLSRQDASNVAFVAH